MAIIKNRKEVSLTDEEVETLQKGADEARRKLKPYMEYILHLKCIELTKKKGKEND